MGESGLGNFGGVALVNAVDSRTVRDNLHNPHVNPATAAVERLLATL